MEYIIQSLKNNFVVVLLEEKAYEPRVFEFLNEISKKDKRICYVLINNFYAEAKKQFRKNGVSLKNIFFIDILSMHYEKLKNESHCMYIKGPDIPILLIAIGKTIKNKKCKIVLFDNIGSLLTYYPTVEIEKLTNTLKTNNGYRDTKKLYLMQKNYELLQEEAKNLINDLQLFADKIIEV